MPGGVLIGIDIGTTALKAVMVGPRRGAAGGAFRALSGAPPGSGRGGAGPGRLDGRRSRRRCRSSPPIRGRARSRPSASPRRSTRMCSAGADLAPLRRAITWQDTRAGADGAALDARIAPEAKVAALGAPIPIDASHALSRMAFVARTEPEVWARTRHVLLPKDWAIARLTGEVVADPLSAVGLAGPDLRYADAILALVPEAARLLAPLRDPLDLAGAMRGGPFAGVPVATGTMDAWASMFGLGVADEGEAMYLSGTSEVMGLISAARTGEPGVITFPEWRGITLHAGPTQAGGASLDWLCRLLGREAGGGGCAGGVGRDHAREPAVPAAPRRGARAALGCGLARGLRGAVEQHGPCGPVRRRDGGRGVLGPPRARGAGAERGAEGGAAEARRRGRAVRARGTASARMRWGGGSRRSRRPRPGRRGRSPWRGWRRGGWATSWRRRGR